jgi:drug/metabolite transporter (DMT)-like permease
MQGSRIVPVLALTTAGCLWGTGFFFGKVALGKCQSPRWFCFGSRSRAPDCCLLSSLTILGSMGRMGLGSLRSGPRVPVQYLVQFKGLALTTVSHASLMVGTLRMFVVIAAVLFFGEQLHFGGWLALVSATIGDGLIALSTNNPSGGAHASMCGDLLIVLSMFAAIVWILISKRLMWRHTAVNVTASVYWIGTVLLAAVVTTTSGIPSVHYSTRAWVAVAEQGLLAIASTTVLWNWGLKRVPASQAGIFVNLEPLVGAILGVSVLH